MPDRKPDAGSQSREQRENEIIRPDGEGRPPQPSTTPPGAEPSTRSPKTATDPATGEPTRERPPDR